MNSSQDIENILIGTAVLHPTFGRGRIVAVSEQTAEVDFDSGKKAFKRSNFFAFFSVVDADLPQTYRIKKALQEGILIPQEASCFMSQIGEVFPSYSQQVEQVYSDGEVRLRLFTLQQQNDEKKPVINQGSLTGFQEGGQADFEYEVLFLLDASSVSDAFVEEWFLLEIQEDLLLGGLEIARIFDTALSYYVHFFQEYEGGLSESLVPSDNMVLGLRIEKEKANIQDLMNIKKIMETFVTSCDAYIQQFAIQATKASLKSEQPFPGVHTAGQDFSNVDWQSQEEAGLAEEIALSYHHFVIISNRRLCINKQHDLRKVIAIMKVIFPDGEVETKRMPAYHCQTCDEYYLHEFDYEQMKRSGGIPLCKMISEKVYGSQGTGQFANLQDHSPLNQCGYNVNKNENLSQTQRRTILDNVICFEVQSLLDVKSHIAWLIKKRRSFPRYRDAVMKWESDLDYLNQTYHEDGSKVNVSSLTERIWMSEKNHFKDR